MDQNSDRFLSAFNAIERHLRDMLGEAQHRSFSDLVHRAGDSHALVRRLSADLRHLAELRNFLVHRYQEHEPLALPSGLSIQKVERIRDALLRPATLHALFHKTVFFCRPLDPVGATAQLMHKHDIRQLPIYEGSDFRGLLTSQTLTRWLAARLATGVGLVEEEAVEKVMEFQTDHRHYEFADHRATVTDAFNLMEEHYHKGRPMRAIILTPLGRKSQLPTGIVTAGDFPALLEAVGL